MRLPFKQGILSHQVDLQGSQDFLRISGPVINLGASNTPFMYSVSMGSEDVVFTVVGDIQNCWVGINPSQQTWLGIEHDRITGQRRFFTSLQPPVFSPTMPVVGDQDKFWFNTSTSIPYLCKTGRYVKSVAIILGYTQFNQIYTVNGTSSFVGSVVGMPTESVGGHIVTDYNMKPILKPDGTYLTTASPISTLTHVTSNVRIGSSGFLATAGENIAKYHVVKLKEDGLIELCDPIDTLTSLWGIIEDDANIGETVRVCVEGFFETRNVSWSKPGAPLYIGDTGVITETPNLASPVIGYTVSPTSFVIRSSGGTQPPILGGGQKGEKGSMGSTGSQGDKGEIGGQGDTGPIGEKGDKGDAGPQGLAGDKGDVGEKGSVGDIGPQGITGEKGDNGDKGDAGNKGDSGALAFDVIDLTSNTLTVTAEQAGNWYIAQAVGDTTITVGRAVDALDTVTVGASIIFTRTSMDSVTFVGDVGITILTPGSLLIDRLNGTVVLTSVSEFVWVLGGDIS